MNSIKACYMGNGKISWMFDFGEIREMSDKQKEKKFGINT